MALLMQLTPKQIEANKLLGGHQHVLLFGGSRSGKTFLIMRAIVIRALKAYSSHAVLRQHFNALKKSIILDTLPTLMSTAFPNVGWDLNRSDWFATFPNGSRIFFGGLDDNERAEKVLGQEHSTIYLNEASQISYGARNKALTRLAQNSGLKRREYIDCNPPPKGHWVYRLIMKGIDPISRKPINIDRASMLLNPTDNLANLPAGYISILESLPKRDRDRFLHGKFSDDEANALWPDDIIAKCRLAASMNPDFDLLKFSRSLDRIVIAIDPSGCSGAEDYRSDEIGIIAAGNIGKKSVVLEDASGHYSPTGWARAAINLRDKYDADCIVAEVNYGGALVESNIHSVDMGVKVKKITASRGKHVRAEPVSGRYEQGLVEHAAEFDVLEGQMGQFTTHGFIGDTSPDRADALVWAITELSGGAVDFNASDVVVAGELESARPDWEADFDL